MPASADVTRTLADPPMKPVEGRTLMTDATTPQSELAARTMRAITTPEIVIEEISVTHLSGYVDLGPEQHTPFGTVHGGVYCSIVESVGSMGAGHAVADRGQYAVGLNNSTDFFRPFDSGRARITAEAIQQGRTQQLWVIVISDEATGKVMARGQLRAHNLDLPQA
jgi:1,4-dihydroxy-2-naphthoyl-CoA hydrolase